MKIEKIYIDGFGKLNDREFSFEPGLNLIIGPNEAGKSTLQQAILNMLFGFYTGDRLQNFEKQRHARYRPWNTSAYSGSLYLRTDNNDAFRIIRKFDAPEPTTKIIDELAQREITHQFTRKRRGFVSFADQLTGLNRGVFEAVSCVRQGQLVHISESDAQDIAEAVLRLLDSGSSEVSAKSALNRISTGIRKLGTERSKSGPIFSLRSEIGSLERLKQQHKDLHFLLKQDYSRLDEITLTLSNLHDEERQIEKEIKLSELIFLKNLLRRLEAVEQRKAELKKAAVRVQPPAPISVVQRDEVVRLSEEVKHIEKRKSELSHVLRLHHEELTKTHADLDKLPVPRAFWQTTNVEVFFQLHANWHHVQNKSFQLMEEQKAIEAQLHKMGLSKIQSHAIAQLNETQFQEIQELAENVSTEKAQLENDENMLLQRRSFFHNIRLALLIGAGTIGLLLALGSFVPFFEALKTEIPRTWILLRYVFTLSLVGIGFGQISGRMQFRMLLDKIASEKKNIELRIQDLEFALAPFGVSTVSELIQMRLKYLDIQRINAHASSHFSEKSEIELQLEKWLQKLNLEAVDEENIQRAMQIIRQGTHLRRYITDLNGKLQAIRNEFDELEQRATELSDIFNQVFDEAKIKSESLEHGIEIFKERSEASQKYLQLMQEIRQLEQIETEMLTNRNREEIIEQVTQLKKVVSPGDLTEALTPAKELRRQLRQSQQKSRHLELELVRIQERINERESQLPDLSEIEENIAAAQHKLEDLTKKRRALELAYETINEVAQKAHQEFAPKLSIILGSHLDILTKSKYQKIYINPADFSMQIMEERARTLVPVDVLSFGTREQIYLLLRTAVVQLFSEESESIPMFLDDPLAHADEKRASISLDLLLQLAQQQQIFYFTKDPNIETLIEKLNGRIHIIRIGAEPDFVPYRWAAGTARRSTEQS